MIDACDPTENIDTYSGHKEPESLRPTDGRGGTQTRPFQELGSDDPRSIGCRLGYGLKIPYAGRKGLESFHAFDDVFSPKVQFLITDEGTISTKLQPASLRAKSKITSPRNTPN